MPPKETLGDQPIEEKYQRMMNTIAAVLDESFNGEKKGKDRTTGFILMVFPFDDKGLGCCNYISNARRSDVVELLKEQIKRFENQPFDPLANKHDDPNS